MANCIVKKWNSNLIGEVGATTVPTYFTSKLFTMGDDFTKKKMVYVAVTINWDADVRFKVLVDYRKDIMSSFVSWNQVSSLYTFPNYGLTRNADGTTAYNGGATFILPYFDNNNTLARLYHAIQFRFRMVIDKQNSDGTGNISINDTTLLYRKLRDYSSAD